MSHAVLLKTYDRKLYGDVAGEESVSWELELKEVVSPTGKRECRPFLEFVVRRTGEGAEEAWQGFSVTVEGFDLLYSLWSVMFPYLDMVRKQTGPAGLSVEGGKAPVWAREVMGAVEAWVGSYGEKLGGMERDAMEKGEGEVLAGNPDLRLYRAWKAWRAGLPDGVVGVVMEAPGAPWGRATVVAPEGGEGGATKEGA